MAKYIAAFAILAASSLLFAVSWGIYRTEIRKQEIHERCIADKDNTFCHIYLIGR